MFQKIDQESRKTQSANKSRGRESPNRIYQNLSHKNSSQPKVVNLFRNNPIRSSHYLQTSIDVNDINKKLINESHQRIKTEVDKYQDFNKRVQPTDMQMLINRIEKNRQQNKVQRINRLKAVRVNQGRDIFDINKQKQCSQPDLSNEIVKKTNNYIKNQQLNLDEHKYNYFLHRVDQHRKQIRSDDVTPIRKSIFQQIQDFSDTKLDQINLTKEEDIMQFSFGLQYNKSRNIRRFPKDIFYGDVRKAKKNLSLMQ